MPTLEYTRLVAGGKDRIRASGATPDACASRCRTVALGSSDSSAALP